jgi:hypothetical protein
MMYLISDIRQQTSESMLTAAGPSVALLAGAGAVAHAVCGKHDTKIERF